jgi:hypothetical protein
LITYGILQPREFLVDGGALMIRAVDLGNPFIDFNEVVRVPLDVELPYRRSRLQAGDVLVSIAGTLGAIGITPQFDGIVNINQSVARIRTPEMCDPFYLAAYLMTQTGQLLLAREAVGSVQRHFNLEDLPGVITPMPETEIQRCIGNKIRKALRLTESGKRHVGGVLASLDAELSPGIRSPSKRFVFSPATTLGFRLDAEYYRDDYVHLERFLSSKTNGTLVDLGDIVSHAFSGAAIPSDAFITSGVPVIQIKDIQTWGIDLRGCVRITAAESHMFSKYVASDGYLLTGMSGTLGRTAIVHGGLYNVIINQRVAALKPADAQSAGYLWAYLNHPIGSKQFARKAVGGVQDNISMADILQIKVWLPDEDSLRKSSDEVMSGMLCHREARDLLEAAKRNVEELINGTLSLDTAVAEGTEIDGWLHENKTQHRKSNDGK